MLILFPREESGFASEIRSDGYSIRDRGLSARFARGNKLKRGMHACIGLASSLENLALDRSQQNRY